MIESRTRYGLARIRWLLWNFIYLCVVEPGEEPLTSIERWRLLHFGSPENSGPGANDRDFRGDAVNNLLKFATGQPPHSPGRMPGELSLSDGKVRFAYSKWSGAVEDGMRFSVEWSETALPGSWTTLGLVEEIQSIEGNLIWMVAEGPIKPSGRSFFRLRVKLTGQ